MELELLTKVTWNTSITSSNVALFVHVLLFVFLGWGGVELTLFEFKKNVRTSEVSVSCNISLLRLQRPSLLAALLTCPQSRHVCLEF